jgi:hypothetical protein
VLPAASNFKRVTGLIVADSLSGQPSVLSQAKALRFEFLLIVFSLLSANTDAKDLVG